MFDHRGGGRGGMGPGGPPMNPRHFSLPGLPGLDFTQVLCIHIIALKKKKET